MNKTSKLPIQKNLQVKNSTAKKKKKESNLREREKKPIRNIERLNKKARE